MAWVCENSLFNQQQQSPGIWSLGKTQSLWWLNTWDKWKEIILHGCCGHSKTHCCKKSCKLSGYNIIFKDCFSFTLISSMAGLGRQYERSILLVSRRTAWLRGRNYSSFVSSNDWSWALLGGGNHFPEHCISPPSKEKLLDKIDLRFDCKSGQYFHILDLNFNQSKSFFKCW